MNCLFKHRWLKIKTKAKWEINAKFMTVIFSILRAGRGWDSGWSNILHVIAKQQGKKKNNNCHFWVVNP